MSTPQIEHGDGFHRLRLELRIAAAHVDGNLDPTNEHRMGEVAESLDEAMLRATFHLGIDADPRRYHVGMSDDARHELEDVLTKILGPWRCECGEAAKYAALKGADPKLVECAHRLFRARNQRLALVQHVDRVGGVDGMDPDFLGPFRAAAIVYRQTVLEVAEALGVPLHPDRHHDHMERAVLAEVEREIEARGVVWRCSCPVPALLPCHDAANMR